MNNNDTFVLKELLERQQKNMSNSTGLSLATRKSLLLRLKSMLLDHEEAFIMALKSDMAKHHLKPFHLRLRFYLMKSIM
ncbi:hypothetical protein JCM21714_1940 [Gracilibacillus boraciitolerans JCM 21714]|uniref:Aldehyde dehydrogenase n=1 Tax=Gracilibacillus boraciitolerans JCM 21714 TaxID=1298598 RepID=W4VI95_9BACI|nr:hypothetical protein [Gracilibacillus boraciitolerans]GAE92917.1 hypothetical protein JCM21714_1940 [Gracilibacillus boraciitolerans JCM 21714]